MGAIVLISGPAGASEIDAGGVVQTTDIQNISGGVGYSSVSSGLDTSCDCYHNHYVVSEPLGTPQTISGGSATVDAPADGSYLRYTINGSLNCSISNPQTEQPGCTDGTAALTVDGKAVATWTTDNALYGGAINQHAYVALAGGVHTVALEVTLTGSVVNGQDCSSGYSSTCPGESTNLSISDLLLEVLGPVGTSGSPGPGLGEIGSPIGFGVVGLGLAASAYSAKKVQGRKNEEAEVEGS